MVKKVYDDGRKLLIMLETETFFKKLEEITESNLKENFKELMLHNIQSYMNKNNLA